MAMLYVHLRIIMLYRKSAALKLKDILHNALIHFKKHLAVPMGKGNVL